MPFGSMIVHIAKSKTKDDPIGIHNCSYCKNNYKDKREMKGYSFSQTKVFEQCLHGCCNIFVMFFWVPNWNHESGWAMKHSSTLPLSCCTTVPRYSFHENGLYIGGCFESNNS
jgi:hypothetical protein